MNTERISIRYARALIDAAKPLNLVDTAFNDLIKVEAILSASQDLRNLIKSPIIKAHHKIKIFKEIFSNQVSEIVLNFLVLLADKRREILIPDIIKQFKRIYYTEQGLVEIDIYTANELAQEIKKKIEDNISKKLNLKIISNYIIDKSLKGGIKVKVEDTIYDASVSTMLNKLHQKLISEN
ncbi:MAG: ATP synthase F1 subunit delta [Ignavibacteria bacterium]|nr:ATP synthase F1 subunit delta [Ignavibacteria bacterium]